MSNKSNNVDPIVAMSNTMLYLQRKLEETEQNLAFKEKDLALAEKQIAEMRQSALFGSDRLEWVDYEQGMVFGAGEKGMPPIVFGLYEVCIENDRDDYIVTLGRNRFTQASKLRQYVRRLECVDSISGNGFVVLEEDIKGCELVKVCVLYFDKYLIRDDE